MIDRPAVQRCGPMTLGQIAQLTELEDIALRAPESVWTRNLVLRWPLPERLRVSSVTAALRLLAERHEAIRTTFATNAQGDPYQSVHAPGEEVIEVVDYAAHSADDRLVGGGFVSARAHSARRQPLALDASPPIRFEVLADCGRAREVLAVTHHIVADARTSQLLHQELLLIARALEHGEPPPPGRPRKQPIDVAMAQLPDTAKWDQLARWRDAVESAPPTQMPVLIDDLRDSSYTATFESTALQHTLSDLAQRHRMLPAQILLGLYTFAMAHYTGLSATVICIISSNRFAYPSAVHCCALRIPCVVPAAANIRDILPGVRDATTNMYRNADYDARELGRLLAAHQAATGFNTRFRLEFNFFTGGLSGGPTLVSEGSAHCRPGVFRYEVTQPADPSLTYLEARPGNDRSPTVLRLESNEAFIPLPTAEALLRCVEALAGELSADDSAGGSKCPMPSPPASVLGSWQDQLAAARRPQGRATGSLARYHNGLVDTVRVARAVQAELGGGVPVSVEIRGRGTECERLVAVLPTVLEPSGVDALRVSLQHRARRDAALVVPQEFVCLTPLSAPGQWTP
ncbi:condensation domain-containing protein [Kitasatospora purpeofusca]|uniref:condensation domain-containing protein n=1 Tax=Kitasatospora purpeofusca TaxID=67352 RepID=UPI00324E81DE